MKCWFLLLPLLFLGCTANYFYLSPQIENPSNQKKIYFEDNEVIVLQGKNTTLGVFGYQSSSYEITLNLIIRNNSNEVIDVIPEDFEFKTYFNFGEPKPMRVYNAKGYLKKIKSKHNWQMFAASMSAALSNINAGRSSQTTTGIIGNERVILSTETYDYGKQQEVQQQNLERLSQLRQSLNYEYAQISTGLLKRHSLLPNQVLTGIVMINYYLDELLYKKPTYFRFIVPIGEDKYNIRFNIEYPVVK